MIASVGSDVSKGVGHRNYRHLKEVRTLSHSKGGHSNVTLCVDQHKNPFVVKRTPQCNIMSSSAAFYGFSENSTTEVQLHEIVSGHSNICTLLEHYIEPGTGDRVAILEFHSLELADLIEKYSAEGQFLSESFIRQLFAQICHGIGHIHSHEIAHCDLKAENIMLASSNATLTARTTTPAADDLGSVIVKTSHETAPRTKKGFTSMLTPATPTTPISTQTILSPTTPPTITTSDLIPQIIDFGLATKFLKQGNIKPRLGTNSPPEIQNVMASSSRWYQETVDGVAIDMWGLGCIFFRLWFGAALKLEDNIIVITAKQFNIDWQAYMTHKYRRKLPDPAMEVLGRLLEIDPTKRPKNMSELLGMQFFKGSNNVVENESAISPRKKRSRRSIESPGQN